LTWAEPRTPEWFDARRSIITATDVVAILGLHADKEWGRTSYHVWLSKRGEEPDRGDSKPAKWGRKLEQMVGDDWAEQTPGVSLLRLPVLRSIATEWVGFSPDFAVVGCPDGDGPCGAEVKTRNAWSGGSWRDDVPDDVLAQVQWGCMVAGWSHMHIPHLIGGQWDACHRVDYDPALAGFLTKRAEVVWRNVAEGTPPEVDPSQALTSLLNAMFPDRSGTALVDPEAAARFVGRYQRASAVAKAAEARKESARHALIAALGDVLWTYKRPAPGTARIPADQMRRLQRTSPEVYAHLLDNAYAAIPDPAPTFRLTKGATDLTERTRP
jgi:predicted phage-related endonuclease